MAEVEAVANCPRCVELATQVEQLQRLVLQLQQEVRQLKAQLQQNSSNSHKPPSSDPPWAGKSSGKKPTGRKPGGQIGHQGHHRKRLPPGRVDRVVAHLPSYCRHCQAPLPKEPSPQEGPSSWHQTAELPPLAAVITEHQAHARVCPCCGKLTRGVIPAEVRAHVIGPRLAAVMSYLAGRCHDGRRTVAEVASDLFGVPLSLGTVCAYESQMSDVLSRHHEEALAEVRAAAAKNVDETGWKKAGKRRWLWAAATQKAAVFAVQTLRSFKGLCHLLGRGAGKGVIVSDRWHAYWKVGCRRRQVCWAHLKRDFQKWAEKSEQTRLLGEDGLSVCRQVFASWRDFRQRRIGRAELQRQLRPAQKRLNQVLNWALACGDAKAATFCRNVLSVWPALWTFARVEGLEPTNNHAERMLRSAVLWRKNSFGCHSEAGCRFVERMLSVIQSLRLQKRNVLEFLCQSLVAHRTGLPFPKLIG